MSQPVKLIALLKAKPGLSREQFEKRWVEGHAPLTLKFKNLRGYRINIAIEEYQEIEGELPYDGTAELWWDSLEDDEGGLRLPGGPPGRGRRRPVHGGAHAHLHAGIRTALDAGYL